MTPKLVRIFLSLAVCPLLGAMLARSYAPLLAGDPSADSWGWACGAIIGLAFAVGLLRLALAPEGTRSRAAGDLVLVALCALALADIIAQLARVTLPWLLHATGVVYVIALLLVLRRLLRRREAP